MTEQIPSDAELKRPASSRLGVLGQPIAHSKSPAIHRAAFELLDVEWQYDAFDLGEQDLEAFLAGLGPEWRGFSVTMPLKDEAHRLSSVVDPVAEESGVVNTLLRLVGAPDGAPKWAGFNTDVEGLARAIARVDLDASHTVVVGAGATAVSAILAARRLGASSVVVMARNAGAICELITQFAGSAEPGSSPIAVTGLTFEEAQEAGRSDEFSGTTLVISTLPGPAGEAAFIPDRLMSVPLFDVAYEPWPSPLSARWAAAGGSAHAGLEMLVEQALIQERIFVNGDPGASLDDEQTVLDAMRAASVER